MNDVNEKRLERGIYIALALMFIGGLTAIISLHQSEKEKTPPASPSDMKLVSGDPRRDWVATFHDQKRAMTCYVNTQHGGIWCTEDITIQDALGMMAYRDAGLP